MIGSPPSSNELLERLAFLGIVVEFGDHLTDRELYGWLTEGDRFDAQITLLGDTSIHFAVIGSGSDEDNRIYLTFYASKNDRAYWKAQFPDEELPPRKTPPFDRQGGRTAWASIAEDSWPGRSCAQPRARSDRYSDGVMHS
jgi:hypothetical protein